MADKYRPARARWQKPIDDLVRQHPIAATALVAFVLGALTLPLLRPELWARLFPTSRAQAE